MKTLPIEFDFNFVDEAKAVFKVLGNRAPLPLSQEIRTDEHLAIDRMVLNYFWRIRHGGAHSKLPYSTKLIFVQLAHLDSQS